MATLTREEVVSRAYEIFPKCGYIWGAYPNGSSHCAKGADGIGYETSSGPYLSTDCSGFVSWCWMTTQKYSSGAWRPGGTFGNQCKARVSYTGDIETDFPGITPGDALYRGSLGSGHVALYVGGDEVILQASTKYWNNTNTGRGMTYGKGSLNFDGYCAYDKSSFDWDEDDYPDFDPGSGDISPGPHDGTPYPGDDLGYSSDFMCIMVFNNQYTKRYSLMKAYRRC